MRTRSRGKVLDRGGGGWWMVSCVFRRCVTGMMAEL